VGDNIYISESKIEYDACFIRKKTDRQTNLTPFRLKEPWMILRRKEMLP